MNKEDKQIIYRYSDRTLCLIGDAFYITWRNKERQIYVCDLENVDDYIKDTRAKYARHLENFMYKLRNSVEAPELLN